ncbi:MAG: outer membrane protein, partial [bacterium]|nr:outer membrane protein [bacterium]
GATNYFKITYTIFGDIVKSQYPSLLPSYFPADEIVDLSYLKTLSAKKGK